MFLLVGVVLTQRSCWSVVMLLKSWWLRLHHKNAMACALSAFWTDVTHTEDAALSLLYFAVPAPVQTKSFLPLRRGFLDFLQVPTW